MRKRKFTTLAFYSLALVLLLGLGLGLHQYYIYKVTREKHKTTVDRNLSLMHMRADGYLERLALDGEFIAISPILRMYLENPSAETLARAQDALRILASLRPDLDQLRYIDQQGMERIRLNHRGGPPQLETELQNKSDRDYVQRGLALTAGGVYVSPIDLNIEHGQIERPFRPMLRSVAKVMVNGSPAGMVVLNANADELEKRLRTVLPTALEQPVVLNSSGGWIMGGGEKDWLFSAKPDAPDALLSTQEPALWEKIQASPSGQFEYGGECHYYAWYQFKQKQWQSPRWLVAQRSAGQACGHLTASAVMTWAAQLTIASIFAVPLLVLWQLSRWNARELRRGLRQTSVQLELITREADLGLLMVDHECRVCWINPESERLLGWKADELIGANLHERTHMRNGEDLHSGPCSTLQALQTGQRYRNDRDRLLTKSGEILNVSIRVSPFGEVEARKAIVTIADVGDAVDREERLTRLATTDPLTGALNRRSIMERLQDMVEHQKIPPCVLMGDIDFFKKVNDTYGHAAGDEVLKTFTNTIRQLLRKGDFLGRLGGEEFVVALENIDLPNAQTMAERLRLAIANSQTPNDGGIPIAITASFGLALYSRDESVDAWLARADAALYRAKQSGRNRVEIA